MHLWFFIVSVIAAGLGYWLAKRFGRDGGIWAAVCFLMPLALAVLLFLGPPKPQGRP